MHDAYKLLTASQEPLPLCLYTVLQVKQQSKRQLEISLSTLTMDTASYLPITSLFSHNEEVTLQQTTIFIVSSDCLNLQLQGGC